MDIVFVRTRHHYDQYMDFFKLAELSGFPIIYIDELDVSKPGVYIASPWSPAEWPQHIDSQNGKPREAHLILWDLERPIPRGGIGGYKENARTLFYRRWFDEIWVSDRQLASEARLNFVILGSDKGLADLSQRGPHKYYFTHLMYLTDRRKGIIDAFDGIRIGPNCWGDERDKTLKQSMFGLNIHQDNHPFQEPLRFALFAAYALPIISESMYDAYPWNSETMITAGYDGIVSKIKQLLDDDYGKFQRIGQEAHHMMTETYQFGKMVRAAVEESVLSKWR
jgi:hypothetical protein